MNFFISYIKDESFIKSPQIDTFIESLENNLVDTSIHIINLSSFNISITENKNIRIYNLKTGFYGEVYDFILSNILTNLFNENDYFFLCNAERILLNKNPFEYINNLDKNLYFYNYGLLENQNNNKKFNFNSFLKTCNYRFPKLENDVLSIGSYFYAGKCNLLKNLLSILYLELNRNSAHKIHEDAVLSYIYKMLDTMYGVEMLDDKFYKIVDSKIETKKYFDELTLDKSRYITVIE